MQTRNPRTRRNPYVKSGIAGKDAPGGRKKSPAGRIAKTVLVFCIIAAIIFGVVTGVRALFSSDTSTVRLHASTESNIQAMGENVLYYDDMTLYCVAPNGKSRWHFTLGAGADYRVGGGGVIAWAGQQVYVLNKNGVCTFNDRMTSDVLFGAIGQSYIAVALKGASDTESTLVSRIAVALA